MKHRSITAAVASLLLAGTLGGCGGETPSAGPSTGDGATTATGRPADVDVAFAQMMVPHHAQAIQMSEILLAKDGVDPQVRKLAEDIRAAQQPEIDQMTGWLRSWGQPVPSTENPAAMDHSGHVGGMMSEEDMRALQDAEGEQVGRVFLEQMIRHHEGAVVMARDEAARGSYPPAVTLARTIVADQQAEIATMQDLLTGP